MAGSRRNPVLSASSARVLTTFCRVSSSAWDDARVMPTCAGQPGEGEPGAWSGGLMSQAWRFNEVWGRRTIQFQNCCDAESPLLVLRLI